jgi:N utilization substance protein B
VGKRRKAREIVLQILYQLEVNPLDFQETLASFWDNFTPPEDAKEFIEDFVGGVFRHRVELDVLVDRYSEHWRVGRMGRVDRNILRMGVWELLYGKDAPPKVVLNEAIELGKRFGSEDSGAFINGILDRVQRDHLVHEQYKET